MKTSIAAALVALTTTSANAEDRDYVCYRLDDTVPAFLIIGGEVYHTEAGTMEKLSEWCDLGADCSTSLSEDNGRDEFIQIFSINGVADYPFRCTNDLFKYKLPLSSQSQE